MIVNLSSIEKIAGIRAMLLNYINALIANNIIYPSMDLINDKITKISHLTDSFCKEFDKSIIALLGHKAARKSRMSFSEVITVMVSVFLSLKYYSKLEWTNYHKILILPQSTMCSP